MKRITSTLLLLLAITFAWGQTEQRQMILNMKDGTKRTFNTEDIDFVNFIKVEVSPEGELNIDGTLSIAIPTEFHDSYVMDVKQGDDKIAEICLEYIRPLQEQRVVVYPVNRTSHKVDLTAGISANDGGTVVWDEAANTVTYTAGSAPLTTLYISNDGLSVEAPASVSGEATVSPSLIEDIRGTETTYYKIVKIGTQYWMAENLATQYFLDGTEIPQYGSSETATWNANTTGACHVYANNIDDMLPLYGRLYNGYALENEKGLAPEGWEVPTIDQWQTLKTYAGSSAALYKDDTMLSWSNDGEGNNLTGFSALPGGYFSSATSDAQEGADAYFWSTTIYYDALLKQNTLNTVRLNNAATGFVIYKTSGHAYNFGHSVRCVRK